MNGVVVTELTNLTSKIVQFVEPGNAHFISVRQVSSDAGTQRYRHYYSSDAAAAAAADAAAATADAVAYSQSAD